MKTDPSAKARCVNSSEVREWLAKVHRRAENNCFETSAVDNIGISVMIDWLVKAVVQNYEKVEKAKVKHI